MAVQQLPLQTDTTSEFQNHLEKLMSEWPMVCTNEVGHSSVLKHCINTIDEEPTVYLWRKNNSLTKRLRRC